MGLYPNPNRMRDWDMNEGMNQPIKRIGFSLQPKTLKLGKEKRKWRTHGVVAPISMVAAVSTQKMREVCI